MLNAQYQELASIDDEFWKWLEVPYDQIHEFSHSQRIARLALVHRKRTELLELCTVCGLEVKEEEEGALRTVLQSISPKLSEKLSLLAAFQLRRPRTIQKYYDGFSDSTNLRFTTTLAQLVQLFDQSPTHLINIYVQHSWDIKATGQTFTLSNKLPFTTATKLVKEKGFRDTYTGMLFKSAGEDNKYQVLAYYIYEESYVLISLRKQVGDVSRADFDQPIRNKEVAELLIQIRPASNQVEFKHTNKTERETLVKYLQETFDCSVTEVQPDVYDEFEPEHVLRLLSGKEETKELDLTSLFRVESVTFRTDKLKNGPDFTLRTENVDVWDSVKHAQEKDCVSLRSIKDLKSLSFVSEEVNRTIRSQVLPNGNVVFSYDDRSVNLRTKERINQHFLKRFGFPLFHQIANEKFPDGKADKIDFAMSNVRRDASVPNEIYEELVRMKVMKQEQYWVFHCQNPECRNQYTSETNDITSCKCGASVREEKVIQFTVDLEQAEKYIDERFTHIATALHLQKRNKTQLTVEGTKYGFITFQKQDGELIKVHVTTEPIRRALINRIRKIMTPTLLVVCGSLSDSLGSYQDDCIQAITFGDLFSKEDTDLTIMVKDIIEDIALRERHYIGRAANKAYQTLTRLVEQPEAFKKSYSSQFEDDVFAVIKNILPNATKWGREASGKKVPEGVFTIGFRTRKPDAVDHCHVFSYDCKYTDEQDGYVLDVKEQRKAYEYVSTLNTSDCVSDFASTNQLSGHIFISNRFRPNDYTAIKDYFDKQFDKEQARRAAGTPPIFMDVETLLHLHKAVEGNWHTLEAAQHRFYHRLFEALQPASGTVSKGSIDQAISAASKPEAGEIKIMDMKDLKKEIL